MTESHITYTLYGIKNCDTVKKARHWLDQQEISYHFHDYRQDGLDPAWLKKVSEQLGCSKLLNRQGTTWRKLTKQQQESINSAETAIALMLEQPAVIKRPLLSDGQHYLLGFNSNDYAAFVNGRTK